VGMHNAQRRVMQEGCDKGTLLAKQEVRRGLKN
jgi:hypothetical protein